MAKKIAKESTKKSPVGKTPKTTPAKVITHKLTTESVKKSIAKSTPKATPGKKITKKMTPKKVKAKRIFFTAGDDCKILVEILKKGKKAQSKRAQELTQTLHRSVESIRDRMKKYISKLSPADQKMLKEISRKNPKFFVHFKPGEQKTIDAITAVHPSLFNREGKLPTRKKNPSRVPRKRGKTLINPRRGAQPPGPKVETFSWIIAKLKDRDPYFSLDHAVSLLSDTFSYLIETGKATAAQVEQFIRQAPNSINFDDIFTHFNLKQE